MEKEQPDLVSLKKEDNESTTLEISTTGYGLVSLPKENKEKPIQHDNA
jgi:hypothetical protein